MRMTVSEIKAAVQGAGDVRAVAARQVVAVTADSRKVTPGSLFACLKGERADGHDFAAKAVADGAAVILASRELPDISGAAAVLLVQDVEKALGRLARYWRIRTGATVAALTGSAGKTTAKELLASIMGCMGPCVKNPGNFNNQLGLPLTMLSATEDQRVWILELGISRPGDMEELSAICQPDLAVVHNIGPAHLEGLGSIEGVAAAKAKVFSAIRYNGIGLANMDYPELWEQACQVLPEVRGMSTKRRAVPYYGAYVGPCEDGRGTFELYLEGDRLEVTLPCQGAHLAENVLAAAASARVLGAVNEMIVQGLAQAVLPAQRFQSANVGRFTVIDDTYNANPLSMHRAIEAASAQAGPAGLVLVLGEMGELGQSAAQAHEELGRKAASSGCRAVFYKGAHAGLVEAGLSQQGYAGAFFAVKTPAELLEAFNGLQLEGGTVLFKGSRSQRMEEFLAAFTQAQAGAGQ